MSMTKLAILIPTYNRKDALLRNILSIIESIHLLGAMDTVRIYISDNASTDGTSLEIHRLINTSDVRIDLFTQKNNLGSISNFQFLIQNAEAEYFMLLGDDDYFDVGYLEKVIDYIKSNSGITAIVPNCYNTSTWKYRTPLGNDEVLQYPACLKCVILATQMSGLVFMREGLEEKLKELNSKNNYLQIFFVGYSAKKGNLVHIKSNPLEITIPSVRGWNYSDDMLMDDSFETLVFLELTYLQRVYYEMQMVSLSAISYIVLGVKKLCFIWLALWKGRNTTIVTKLLFPLYIVFGFFKGVFRRIRFVLSPRKEMYIKS